MSATAVARSPTWMLTQSADRAPELCAAAFHQWSVNPLGGQVNVRSTLNELTITSASGT